MYRMNIEPIFILRPYKGMKRHLIVPRLSGILCEETFEPLRVGATVCGSGPRLETLLSRDDAGGVA